MKYRIALIILLYYNALFSAPLRNPFCYGNSCFICPICEIIAFGTVKGTMMAMVSVNGIIHTLTTGDLVGDYQVIYLDNTTLVLRNRYTGKEREITLKVPLKKKSPST